MLLLSQYEWDKIEYEVHCLGAIEIQESLTDDKCHDEKQLCGEMEMLMHMCRQIRRKWRLQRTNYQQVLSVMEDVLPAGMDIEREILICTQSRICARRFLVSE